jgi:hypothetical protein
MLCLMDERVETFFVIHIASEALADVESRMWKDGMGRSDAMMSLDVKLRSYNRKSSDGRWAELQHYCPGTNRHIDYSQHY